MNQLKFYMTRLRLNMGSRSKPAGIPWLPGPGLHDLYPKPQMAFCWHQPGDMLSEELPEEKGVLSALFAKLEARLKVKD